jgi:N-acetylglucosaminyldiphosphoundecaprenol N-acetyl-beta-D-mannosaminyltransferase
MEAATARNHVLAEELDFEADATIVSLTLERTARRGPPFRTIPLMGLPFAVVDEAKTVEHVLGELARGRGGWLCTANLDILRQWHRSPDVRGLLAGVDIVVADGMPIVWASALQGTPLPERVAGSTLTSTLSAAAAQTGASVFLLGGDPGAAAAAGAILGERNPGLALAGTHFPPFGFEQQPDAIAEIEFALAASQPDIVFVGLPFPRQELLIQRLRALLPNSWFIGCGVTFSFIAGDIKRAPRLVQRFGLEWLHRLVQEPSKLWRRYLLDGLPFMVELMSSSIVGRRRPALQIESSTVSLQIESSTGS